MTQIASDEMFNLECCTPPYLGSLILLDNNFEKKPLKQGGQIRFIKCGDSPVLKLFTPLAGLLKVDVVDYQDDASWYTLQ